MTHTARQLLDAALALPDEARLQIAASLLESVEPVEGTPQQIEAAWTAEIRHRLAEHRAGKGRTYDAFAVLKNLEARVAPANGQRKRRRQ